MTTVVMGNNEGLPFKRLNRFTVLMQKRGSDQTDRFNIAFLIFTSTHQKWAELGLDTNFFELRILPMIELYQRYGQLPSPQDIALAWDEEFGCGHIDGRKELVNQLTKDLALFVNALKLAIY
ncbi:MAG: hypothetical protein AAGD96_06145 [Chloroflexota bacterium]